MRTSSWLTRTLEGICGTACGGEIRPSQRHQLTRYPMWFRLHLAETARCELRVGADLAECSAAADRNLLRRKGCRHLLWSRSHLLCDLPKLRAIEPVHDARRLPKDQPCFVLRDIM